MTLPTSTTRSRSQLEIISQYFEVNFDDLAVELVDRLPPGAPAPDRQEYAARHLRLVIRGLRAERDGPGDTDAAVRILEAIEELCDAERDLLRERALAVGVRAVPGLAPAAPDLSAPDLPAPSHAPQARAVPTGARPITQRAGLGAAGVGSVLQALATKTLELLNADTCQVYLEDGDILSLQAEAPDRGRPMGPDRLSPEEGFVRVVRHGRHAIALDSLEFLEGAERTWLDRGIASLAAGPVGAPGDPGSGLLVVGRVTPRPFSPSETMEMAQLGEEVTLALASADLLGRAEELAVLKERMKLAREIHDGLASDLSAVVQMFKYHQHRRRVDPDDADVLLVQMRELVEAALQSARDILSTLRPRQHAPRRLSEGIKQQLESFSRTYGVSAVTKIMGDDAQLVAEEREAIFQVVRESLTNIRKHAQCATVDVTLDMRGRPFVLTVEDDGVGIDLGAMEEKSGSFGLLGMRERAQLLGGTLQIGNGAMGGVRVEFHGPEVPIGV